MIAQSSQNAVHLTKVSASTRALPLKMAGSTKMAGTSNNQLRRANVTLLPVLTIQ